MSSSYCLRVIRIEDLRWRHPLHRNVPDLYVEVTLGNTTRRTKIIKKNISPVWDEPLVFSCDSVDQSTTLVVQVKHHSTWSSDLRIGTADSSPADLLRRCANEESVFLDLSASNKEKGSAGRLFVKLCTVSDVEAASTSIGGMSEDVKRSEVMRLDGTEDVIQSTDSSIARMNSQSDLYRAIGELLSRFDVIRQTLDKLSEIHPFLTIAWNLASALYTAVKGVFETDKRVIGLAHTVVDAYSFVRDVQAIPVKTDGVQQSIITLLRQTIECCLFIRQYVGRAFFRRMLDMSSSEKIEEFERSLGELKQGIDSSVNLSTAFVSMRSSRRIDELVLSQRLNPMLSYAFDRPVCLPGTRIDIRKRILDWIFSESKENVLWLHGVAGSGKSTISMTIVEHLRKMSRLGAFLFFEREKSEPSLVIKSIAYQLAVFDSSIGETVLSKTDKDCAIATASSTQQFDELIRIPLNSAADSMSGPVAIVLDALDECGTLGSRRSLIDIFRKEFPRLPNTFRFVVTSRREADIDKFLSSQPENVLSIELDCNSTTSKEDVLAYIRTEMHTAVREVVEVPPEWPWDENMASLGDAAGGLFIWASTAVKMVMNSDNPFDQLDYLSKDSRSLAGLGLNQLYSAVLRGSGVVWGNKKSKKRFAKVLSLLLLSKVPLTTKAIDGLLGFPPHETSLLILSRLRSVLTYTPGDPVSLFHASFADYLMSSEHRDEPWFIDTQTAKRLTADRCFVVMEDLLRFNICDVKTSFCRNHDDPELADRIKAHIPSHLEYACMYWSQHLIDVDCSADVIEHLSSFALRRLLFWFEVLSLKKQFVRTAVRALDDVASWVGSQSEGLTWFLRDASRLAHIFALPIMESVPQIYISMIPLSRDESRVSAHYTKHIRSAVGIEKNGVKRPSVRLQTLTGHSRSVNSISVSLDGRRIASASWDGTVRVRDLSSGRETLIPCIKHSDRVLSVSFFPDNRRIVSGASDCTVIIWDAENGDIILGPLKGHTKDVLSVAVSPDGSMIASGSDDKTVIIWNTRDGRIVSLLTGHTMPVTSVSFDPDGARLASGSYDKTIKIWNVNNGEQGPSPFVHTSRVFSVAFSPTGRFLVSGSHSGVTVWDSMVGNIIFVLRKHTDCVSTVGYSPCGTRIVSGSWDRTIIIWDAVSGEIVSGPLKGHTHAINCATFSRDGKYIVSGGSMDGGIEIWDATADAVSTTQEKFTGIVKSVAISANSCIASASSDGSIIVWDTLMGGTAVAPLLGHSETITSVAFTPDNLRLISGSWDRAIRIWNVETGNFLEPVEERTNAILCIAMSPDGTKLASGSLNGTVKVWDVVTGALIVGPLHGHSHHVLTVYYSRDGKRLASHSLDGTVIIRDTEGWMAISESLGYRESVECSCFSPDTSLLAFGMWNGDVLIWDPKRGRAARGPLKGHSAPVAAVLFLFDNSHVVSGSGDSMIRVWDTKSGQTIRTFEGHSRRVSSLALSFDHTRLVSGSYDGTVRVWDLSNLRKCGDVNSAVSVSSCRDNISDWILGDDGWIRGGPDQYNLLLWVPPDLRFTLLRPRNMLILRCEFSTKLDFKDASIGERWSECFKL